MSAVPQNHIASGSLSAIRSEIADWMEMARIYAEMGSTYAQIGDDALLQESFARVLGAYRQALNWHVRLKDAKDALQAGSRQ
jgi:hypothetical protein